MKTITTFVLLIEGILGASTKDATPLVSPMASWRYLDDGTDQGADWRRVEFNDSNWPEGPSKLGIGTGEVNTIMARSLSIGRAPVTAYFRHRFRVHSPTEFLGLFLRCQFDDGVVVYLNGNEIFRDNLPAGPPTALTIANRPSTDNGTIWRSAQLAAANLRAGENVLAVEVHQASLIGDDAAFDLELFGWRDSARVRQPYLQKGTSSSATVCWQTDMPIQTQIRYGLTPFALTNRVASGSETTRHSVTLENLAPDTTYFYEVRMSENHLIGADNDHYFRTSPPPDSVRPIRIWAFGDGGTGTWSQRRVRDSYYKYAGGRHTDVWIGLGDNVQDLGTEWEYTNWFFGVYTDLLRKSFFWPALGNHDVPNQDRNTSLKIPYFDAFDLPTRGEAGGVPSNTPRYYSFDYGNIHFVSLDTQSSSLLPGDPMLRWLRHDLSVNRKDWLIVYFHHAPYDRAANDSDFEKVQGQVRRNIVPILEEYGADLVLAGHSHVYQRSYLLDGHYGTSASFRAEHLRDSSMGRPAYRKSKRGPVPREGAVYLVVGTGGELMRNQPVFGHPAYAVNMWTSGSLVVDVEGSRLEAKFVSDLGNIDDSFAIVKGSTQPD